MIISIKNQSININNNNPNDQFCYTEWQQLVKRKERGQHMRSRGHFRFVLKTIIIFIVICTFQSFVVIASVDIGIYTLYTPYLSSRKITSRPTAFD